MASQNTFSILKNAVDSNIEIIRHDESGFYNITKIAKLVNELKRMDVEKEVARIRATSEKESDENSDAAGIPATSEKESDENNDAHGIPCAAEKESNETDDVPGIPGTSQKRKDIFDWIRNKTTKELVESCKNITGLDEVMFELKAGVPTRFAGTYVHRYLYEHFMFWLDGDYAMKASMIIDMHQQEANKIEVDSLKATIKELMDTVKKQGADNKSRMEQLLTYAEDTKEQLDDVQNDLTETKEEVSTVRQHLANKSYTSTKNPKKPGLHRHFAATTYTKQDKTQMIIFTTGAKDYVDDTVSTLVKSGGHAVIIPPFYNANGFDLRHNSQTKFMEFRKIRVAKLNKKIAYADKLFNDKLKLAIQAHNRKNPGNKRSFIDEKQKTKKILIKDIDIKFNLLTVKYVPNPYITFAEVANIVVQTNKETQASPV